MVSGQSMRSGRVIAVTKVCGVKAVKQKMTYERAVAQIAFKIQLLGVAGLFLLSQ